MKDNIIETFVTQNVKGKEGYPDSMILQLIDIEITRDDNDDQFIIIKDQSDKMPTIEICIINNVLRLLIRNEQDLKEYHLRTYGKEDGA